ncbi:hypothetical protein DUI87_20008 [Hirundo rustica rustica]|uniref:Uncharacterized protein n=1 Tax=Hirundo rustica rustica TaxID=333673 RepID=A0A3M0K6T5_HIRRU|nr:hypothetical protein DUI87_20008 [Hirundo rustica rustica]
MPARAAGIWNIEDNNSHSSFFQHDASRMISSTRPESIRQAGTRVNFPVAFPGIELYAKQMQSQCNVSTERKSLLFYLMLKSDCMNNSKLDKDKPPESVLSKVRIELQLIRRREKMVFHQKKREDGLPSEERRWSSIRRREKVVFLLLQCLQRKVVYRSLLNRCASKRED